MKETKELEFVGQIDKFFRMHELRPVTKFVHRGITVFLAEGGPYHIKNNEFPNGWYETAYALLFADPSTGRNLSFIEPIAFEFNHDPQISGSDGRRNARVASAKQASLMHIDEIYKTWLGAGLTLAN